nr:hypothetical protein F511_29086 [Ipomoea batatas]
MKVITSGNNRPNFPPNTTANFNGEPDGAGGLVFFELGAVKGRNGDVIAVKKRRPEVNVLVALIDGGDDGVIGDLLVAIGGEDVEVVVVNSDPGIRVPGGDGDLESGGEDVGGGDVEVEDGGFSPAAHGGAEETGTGKCVRGNGDRSYYV